MEVNVSGMKSNKEREIMKVPKNIAKSVKEYERINKKINELEKELEACKKVFTDWERESIDSGVWIGDLFVADKPEGEPQGDGEYCNQYQYGEDSFSGTYYFPIEGSNKYVAYTYDC